jgi:hypothetical protein
MAKAFFLQVIVRGYDLHGRFSPMKPPSNTRLGIRGNMRNTLRKV